MRGVRVGAQTSRRQSRADGRGGMRCGTGSEHACAIFSPTQTHLSGGTRVGRAVATQVLGRHQALLGPHGVHGLAVQASVAFLVGLIGLGRQAAIRESDRRSASQIQWVMVMGPAFAETTDFQS